MNFATPNVRAAKDYGYNCIVIGDVCATKDLTQADVKVNAKLAALNYFYSVVKSTEEF